MHVWSTLLPILGLSLSATGMAAYILEDDYGTSSFFDKFSFFTGSDPTSGFVSYVDQTTAQNAGLISTGSTVYMGVDHTNIASSPGRQSVRISSTNSYTHGLVILDLAHMAGGIWRDLACLLDARPRLAHQRRNRHHRRRKHPIHKPNDPAHHRRLHHRQRRLHRHPAHKQLLQLRPGASRKRRLRRRRPQQPDLRLGLQQRRRRRLRDGVDLQRDQYLVLSEGRYSVGYQRWNTKPGGLGNASREVCGWEL